MRKSILLVCCLIVTLLMMPSPFAYGETKDINEPPAELERLKTQASEGDPNSQYALALMYYQAQGVPQDYKEAVKWWTKAAEQGDADAQFDLGLMYKNGYGVVQDYKEAVKWWTKAAEQGHADAQFYFFMMYYNGDGVIEDYVESYKWLLLAEMNGRNVSEATKAVLQEKLSPAGIEEGQRRATEFAKRRETNKEDKKEKSAFAETITNLKATGTAFCIHPAGFFITAAHVVEGAESLKIRTEKGVVPAKIISADDGLDIALLKADGNEFTAIPLVPSSGVKTGEKIFTIGFPNIEIQGFEPKYTEGVVSSLSGIQNNPRFFQISVAVQPGNSGGPLVDEKGRVIGVIVSKLDDITSLVVTGSLPQSVNYAVKSSFVLPLLESVEGLDEMPKPMELLREEAIEKVKTAVGLVQCY